MITASIIIPVFNREDFIEQCLTSLLNQQFTGYEIIIVNDGSTDKTEEIVLSFKDPRIRLIQNKENHGPGYSRNQGIQQAKGTFIAFTDSDCQADSLWLRELLKPFNLDTDIMITGGKVIDPEPRTYWEHVNQGGNHVSLQKGIFKLTGCNMAARKEFLLKNPLNEFLLAEDWDLCLSCKKQKKKVSYTNAALVTHYPRTSLRATLAQHFSYGYSNTYINIKHRQFPFFNLGALILITTAACLILGIWNNKFYYFGCMFFLFYAVLVGYWNTRGGTRSWANWGVTYAGYFVVFFAFCLGSLYFPLIYMQRFHKTSVSRSV